MAVRTGRSCVGSLIVTRGETNLTKRPHRRHTWSVQSHSPGGADVYLTHASLTGSNRVHIPNGISIDSAVFAQITTEGPWRSLYFSMSRPFPHPSKLALCMWDLYPSNKCFLGHMQLSSIPNGISIGSAFFSQGSRLWQTDRPTDRPSNATWSVNNRPHLRIYVVLLCGLIKIIKLSSSITLRNVQKLNVMSLKEANNILYTIHAHLCNYWQETSRKNNAKLLAQCTSTLSIH